MSGFAAFITTPEFLTGSFVSGLLGTGLGHLSTRHNEKQKRLHEERMNKRKLAYEAAAAFGEVCSGAIEKSMDIKSVFNAILDMPEPSNPYLTQKPGRRSSTPLTSLTR